MVIADRAAIIVNTVYGDCVTYYGMYIVVATALFAIQIYCDFYGYSTIARGAALILGFHLTDNFKSPYFAKNIKEFWQRWHISLTQWFRDYLYIPLGGNRKGLVRKRSNLLFVFMVSGLWHGSGLSYVVWGLLNGIYQIVGDVWRSVYKKICSPAEKEKIAGIEPVKKNAFEKNLLKRLGTFVLISFSWLFFRSGGFKSALILIKHMAHFNWTILLDHSLYSLGVTEGYFRVLCYAIILLFVIDYKKYMEINVIDKFMELSWWVRILVEMLLIFTILLFGCYGELYDTTQFIYFQF